MILAEPTPEQLRAEFREQQKYNRQHLQELKGLPVLPDAPTLAKLRTSEEKKGSRRRIYGPYPSQAPNLIGQRFGALTVIHRVYNEKSNAPARWFCRCDCGGERITRTNILNRPRFYAEHHCSRNCRLIPPDKKGPLALPKQCRPPEDLAGQRFGLLTVVCRGKPKDYHGAMWTCRCDCGALRDERGYRLRHPRNGRIPACSQWCKARKRVKATSSSPAQYTA